MSISPQTRDFMVRGVLYLLAMCIPIAVSLAWNKPDITLLGGMGALFALFIAPRYTPLPRVLCIGAGGLLVCLAATVGFFTQGNNNLALIPLVLFSWLAALPRPDQAYLSLVVKNMAAAALPHIDVARPSKAIGTNTVACMQSGVYWGYVGLVEGIVREVRRERDTGQHFLEVGGKAGFVFW